MLTLEEQPNNRKSNSYFQKSISINIRKRVYLTGNLTVANNMCYTSKE